MKSSLFLLTCLMCTSLSAQGLLPGLITYQNSGDQPVVGALVKVGQSNRTETDGNGTFSLTIPGKQPGYEVILKVEKPGYEIVNKKELYATLKADASRRFKLYMCPEGEWERNAVTYYQINEKAITARYLEQVEQAKKDLAFSGKVLSDSLARLHEQFQIALRQADDLAQRFAIANLDDASELYKKAFAFFIEGKIDSAIEVLEDDLLDGQMDDAQKEKVEAEMLKAQGARKDSVAQRGAHALARDYALKAQLAQEQIPIDWNAALNAYKKAIELDPEQINYRLTHAQILRNQGHFLQAVDSYRMILELLPESLAKAQIYRQIAQLYEQMGNRVLALEAIENALLLLFQPGVTQQHSLHREIHVSLCYWITWQVQQERMNLHPDLCRVLYIRLSRLLSE